MSEVPERNLLLKLFCLPKSGWTGISIFVILISVFSKELRAQDYFNTTPTFQYLSKVDLPTVTSGSLNYQDLTIAIATGPDGNVYTLTLGRGVDKRDAQGKLLQAGIIPAAQLDSPRDMVIDEEGYFYIADYLAAGDDFRDNGKIRVFDPLGNYLPERTILTSFYRPLGLDVKANKVYVAEYYDGLQGPEPGSTFSRIRIYDKLSHTVLKQNENVELPLRIAVNSSENVYVSQAGTTSAAVLILDGNLSKIGELPGIVSPGSVVVDGYDYIHVLEYGNRIKFSDFINFESISIGDLLPISEQMIRGIQNEEFFVKVFDANGQLVTKLIDRVDFPVDLALSGCENLYVDNADIIPLFGYTPSRIEFDLEIYKRIPTLDAAEAPEISCNETITVDVGIGTNYAVVEFPQATASDACFVTVTQTKGLPSGSQFEIGEHVIEFSAADGAGNISTCNFSIIVNGGEDLPPQFADCPLDIEMSAETGQCGAVVSFNVPTATDETGPLEVNQTEGLSSGSFFAVGEHPIVFQAVDEQGNPAECSFIIKVKDNEIPVVECPDNIDFTVDFGMSGRVVDFELPVVIDNCSGFLIEQTEGLPGGSEFPVGITKNSYRITDNADNAFTCSFNITITENADVEPPVITCPEPIFIDVTSEECGQIINYALPEVSDNSGEFKLELIDGPAPGIFFPIGTTNVTYKATDAAGNASSCSFTVSLTDKRKPRLMECPGDQLEVLSTTKFILPDYSGLVSYTDCSENISITQDPPSGTEIVNTTTIKIIAEDDAGNISEECSFSLIIEFEELAITACPTDKILEVDENCGLTISDYTNEINTNHDAGITQSPPAGSRISDNTEIFFVAEDENGNINQCSFMITLIDTSVPDVTCPVDKQASYEPIIGFSVPNFREEITVLDNCTFEIVQVPAPGTVIFESQNILITVTDSYGNQSSCEFYLELTEVVEPAVEITTCPSEVFIELNADCVGEIPDLTGQVATNISATLTQSPPEGTLVTADTSVEIIAEDSAGNSASCFVTISLEDVTPPEISCGNDILETLNFGEDFILPDYRSLVLANDCSSEISIFQQPSPGSSVNETTQIRFFAEDASGNRSQECAIRLSLQFEPLAITNCPASITEELGEGCSLTLSDYTSEITTNHPAEITQIPAPGTQISGSVLVEFYAEDVNGAKADCSLEINLRDTTLPEINCPSNKAYTFELNSGFVIPDFTALAETSDNCGLTVEQEPLPENVIFESSTITLTVTDASGNSKTCSFEISLTAEESPVVTIITCPTEQILPLTGTCNVLIPDLTSEISTNISAQIEQNPTAGTQVSENTSVEIKATDENGNVDICVVQLIVKDQSPPEITCRGDVLFTWVPENGYVLPDFSANVTVLENCGNYTLRQQPPAGTLLTSETTEISFTAVDDEGNASSCSFMLKLSETEELRITCPGEQTGELDANCAFEVPDFTQLAQVHAEGVIITQDPSPGEIIFANTQINLTASKDERVTTCDFQLTLFDTQPPEVSCVESKVIEIKNGESVSIFPQDLITGSVDNCGIVSRTLSKWTFTSSDVGEQKIILKVFDAAGNEASCETLIRVEVIEDPVASIECVEAISLQLEDTRSVFLDPRTLFSGGSGSIQYTISKEEFNCGDLGEQMVVFNYVTPSKEGSCEIKVIIEDPEGYCELINEEPSDPLPFVIIYPNPGHGDVKIVTSPDISLNKAEVFDMRGRFLFARDFPDNVTTDYYLDLSMYESGVYTIKLNGKEREYVRRAIVNND